MSHKYVYLFSEGDASMRELLGGKGANLAEMTKIGLPVPQGFTVTTEACTQYYEDGREINDEIQAQINAIRKQYDANANEIQDMVDQKNAIDQEIALLHEQVENINKQIAAYGLLIADKQEELDAAQATLEQLRQQNKTRIRTMEEEGDMTYWSVVLQASDFSDLLDRWAMAQEIRNADLKRIRQMDEAAKVGDLFITLTGCCDVIRREHFEVMKDGVLLANSGHFDVEIDKKALKALSVEDWERKPNIHGYRMKDGRVLNLLAEGRLVNLAAGNGHPAEIMDMSFGIQAKGLEYLAKHGKEMDNRVYAVPAEIDRAVALIKLNANNVHIDTLSPEQEVYLNKVE